MNVACFPDAVTQSRLDRAATHHTAADVTVIIPAKQEAQSLGGVIDRTRRYATDVLVIAGESTDGTAEVASRSGASVMADAGRGKGRAIRQAIPHIRTPVAVFLVGRRENEPFAWGRAAIVLGAAIATTGVGRASLLLVIIGIVFAAAGISRDASSTSERTWTTFAIAGVALLAFSALLILPARAAHDPLINQGNPRTRLQRRRLLEIPTDY